MITVKQIYVRLFIIPVRHIKYLYFNLIHHLTRNLCPKIEILTASQTINEIVKYKKSVSRFGDGEISWILGTQRGSFQHGSDKLSNKLAEVLSSDIDNLLICLPSTMNTLKGLDINSKHFWSKTMHYHRFEILYYIRIKKFGDSLFTRPYMIYKNKDLAKEKFQNIKKIWAKREVVIIEGQFTYFGVGNDLLSNVSSVSRIIAPHEDAFEVYDDILNEAKKFNKSVLFLVALGPTATILSYDLAKNGYQSIDIGHVDIEYEWFLRKVKKKVSIPGKYVNEIGNKMDNVNLNKNNELYESSIISRIL